MRTSVVAGLLAIGSLAQADEGMWTFDNFPGAAVKSKLNVTLDAKWLDRVRTSTVRLAGCTGSFVSSGGLILTNHHCVASCLDQLSTKENSLLERGFISNARTEEKRCPTQLADVLVAMENVTDKVQASVRGLSDKDANEARKRTITGLEEACEAASKKDKRTGALKCESVTLYNGGQYFLYKYKRYTDVRIAFAPEAGIAAFGGDPDNFQYPRWCLDMALLRAYENDKPAQVLSHLNIDFQGPSAGDPVFVSGHPGSTDRLLTVSELLFQRNVDLPGWLLRNGELRGRLIQFSKQSDESERIAQSGKQHQSAAQAIGRITRRSVDRTQTR
jgi:hypothetical protein